MLRPPFPGHRRYSITHRAVQRLRELIATRDDEDDEALRDRLDAALGVAEDAGKAIRTLDAMLGEPQTLIPVDAFGDVLYAIIKEDTVVTVLPQGHGEEILQRGLAMEQKVAAGQAKVRAHDREEDRWEHRRRWRKEPPQPVVIERIVRGTGNGAAAPADESTEAKPAAADVREVASEPAAADVVLLPERRPVDGPVAKALQDALRRGRRRAAVRALTETLQAGDAEGDLLPLWKALTEEGVPEAITIGDLIEAVRAVSTPARADAR